MFSKIAYLVIILLNSSCFRGSHMTQLSSGLSLKPDTVNTGVSSKTAETNAGGPVITLVEPKITIKYIKLEGRTWEEIGKQYADGLGSIIKTHIDVADKCVTRPGGIFEITETFEASLQLPDPMSSMSSSQYWYWFVSNASAHEFGHVQQYLDKYQQLPDVLKNVSSCEERKKILEAVWKAAEQESIIYDATHKVMIPSES